LRLRNDLNADYVRSILDYYPETGELRWKFRDHASNQVNARLVGKLAGTIATSGKRKCIQIIIDGKSYLGHRLAWLIMTGEWPKEDIDHKDLDRINNKWENIREASRSQNCCNKEKIDNCTSDFKGVAWHKNRKKWQAYICLNKVQKYLGIFDSQEAAYAAYCKASNEFHGVFSRVA